jgi:hypothetical protein
MYLIHLKWLTPYYTEWIIVNVFYTTILSSVSMWLQHLFVIYISSLPTLLIINFIFSRVLFELQFSEYLICHEANLSVEYDIFSFLQGLRNLLVILKKHVYIEMDEREVSLIY